MKISPPTTTPPLGKVIPALGSSTGTVGFAVGVGSPGTYVGVGVGVGVGDGDGTTVPVGVGVGDGVGVGVGVDDGVMVPVGVGVGDDSAIVKLKVQASTGSLASVCLGTVGAIGSSLNLYIFTAKITPSTAKTIVAAITKTKYALFLFPILIPIKICLIKNHRLNCITTRRRDCVAYVIASLLSPVSCLAPVVNNLVATGSTPSCFCSVSNSKSCFRNS